MRKRILPVLTAALALVLAVALAACGAQPDARPGGGAAESDRSPAAGEPAASEPAPVDGGSPVANPDQPVAFVPDAGSAASGTAPAPGAAAPVASQPADPQSAQQPAPEPAVEPAPAEPAPSGDSAAAGPGSDTAQSARGSDPAQPAPGGDPAQPAPGIDTAQPAPGGGTTGTEPARAAEGPLQFETLVGGSYSGFTRPTQLLIGDAATLRSAWQQYGAMMEPAPELPPVDFSRESVVVVALGERNTGGYSIRVTGVRLEGGKLVVAVATSQPGPGDMVTMAFTQPYHMIKVPVPAAGLKLEVRGMPADSGQQGAADR